MLYQVNENFFKKWSPEMAYILGLIVTDGGIIWNKKGKKWERFEFSSKDKEILMKINKVLSSTYPIRKRETCYVLRISRAKMVKDLVKLGIDKNKTKTVSFPKVPREHLSHFVRGLIDGDGCIFHNHIRHRTKKGEDKNYRYLGAIFSTSSRNLFKDFLSSIKKVGLKISSIQVQKMVWGKGDMLQIKFCGEKAKVFCEWIYNKNDSLRLERKYLKYKEVIC